MRLLICVLLSLLLAAGCSLGQGNIAARSGYREVTERLTNFIRHEMADKGLLFAGGRGAGGRGGGDVITAATLDSMLTPQFAPADARTGYGIGFRISELEGHRRIGYGGAIYGLPPTSRP